MAETRRSASLAVSVVRITVMPASFTVASIARLLPIVFGDQSQDASLAPNNNEEVPAQRCSPGSAPGVDVVERGVGIGVQSVTEVKIWLLKMTNNNTTATILIEASPPN